MADTTVRRSAWVVVARAAVKATVALARLTWPILRAAGYGAVILAVLAYKWVTGARFTHQPRRRYLPRPVRAAGQCLVTAVAVGLILNPLLTAAVLAAAGFGLLGVVEARRNRTRAMAEPAGEPIRVRAYVDYSHKGAR